VDVKVCGTFLGGSGKVIVGGIHRSSRGNATGAQTLAQAHQRRGGGGCGWQVVVCVVVVLVVVMVMVMVMVMVIDD
jgi:hypothetical protein